jgi:hypothetical protein
MSIGEPRRAKGGNFEVTITAAVFLVFNAAPSKLATPNRSNMPRMDSRVNGLEFSLSPLPSRPTTSP